MEIVGTVRADAGMDQDDFNIRGPEEQPLFRVRTWRQAGCTLASLASRMEARSVGAFRIIAFFEAVERLAFCGTQLLLVLYLSQTEAFASGRSMAWAAPYLSGDPAGRSVQIYGLFAAIAYIAPLGGALVATRIGVRATIAIGGGLMTAGHAALATERGVAAGLALLVAGAGCTLSNKLVLVGLLHQDDRGQVDTFARYLIATNIGVVAGPLICGVIGEQRGWSWGFATAAGFMALGTMVYLANWRRLPRTAASTVGAPAAEAGRWWPPVAMLLVPFVIVTTVVNQAYSTVPIWATAGVDRAVGSVTVPVSSLIVFDGCMTIVAIALTRRLWRALAARDREPGAAAKLMIGCGLVATAFTLLGGWAGIRPTPLVGALAFYLVLDLSAAWIEPPLATLVTRLAPAGRSVVPMAMLNLATALAALLLGWTSGFYAAWGPSHFWFANAAAALAAAVLVAALVPVARRWPYVRRVSAR